MEVSSLRVVELFRIIPDHSLLSLNLQTKFFG